MPTLRAQRFAPNLSVRRQGGGHAALAAAALLALAGPATAGDPAAPAKSAPDTGRATVASVVTGIVSYTRWPAEMKSPRLCTLGQGRGVDELRGLADLGATALAVPVRAASVVPDAWSQCDIIYVGAVAIGAQRDLLQSTVGRPVLMIGEGRDFCSDGGMFCLEGIPSAVKFAVNLDAVARSGLRVNPSVLRIARGAPASGP
jgi:hypothetical protein